MTENVAVIGKYYGADGHYLSLSYDEMLQPRDERTAEEIRDDIMNKCGLGG